MSGVHQSGSGAGGGGGPRPPVDQPIRAGAPAVPTTSTDARAGAALLVKDTASTAAATALFMRRN